MRETYLSKIYFSESYPEDARSIYYSFQRLSQKEKVSSIGLVYLYSAWTHIPDDYNFYSEIINYLEKGKDNLAYLRPLYIFGNDKFGNLFQDETPSMKKLKREISQEERDEFKKANSSKMKIHEDFKNVEDKIDFYIESAIKRKKQNEVKNRMVIP